jgi:hypothetical protein
MNTLLNRLPLLVACLSAIMAHAQTPQDLAAARARYKQELTVCLKEKPAVGDSNNCAKEARNAMAEITRGRIGTALTPADYEKNALLRCDAHKGEDKADCIARIQGRGRTEGSVAGGGILRELTTTKVIPAPAPSVDTAPKKDAEAPRPSGLMSNCKWVPPIDWVCK